MFVEVGAKLVAGAGLALIDDVGRSQAQFKLPALLLPSLESFLALEMLSYLDSRCYFCLPETRVH